MGQYVTLILDDEVADYLESLARTGLYGDDRSSAAEHLILEGLRNVVGHRHLLPIRYKVESPFAEVEAPAPAPPQGETFVGGVRVRGYTCAHCQDGGIMPDDAKGANCPLCGTDCIPF